MSEERGSQSPRPLIGVEESSDYRATNEGLKDENLPSQEIQDNVQGIYSEARFALLNNNHLKVWQCYSKLSTQDKSLRGALEKMIRHNPTDSNPEVEGEISRILKEQGFFNKIRLKLLQDITNLLVDRYQEASLVLSSDVVKASELINTAQRIYEYYISNLQDFADTKDRFEQEIYRSGYQVLSVVYQFGQRVNDQMTQRIMETMDNPPEVGDQFGKVEDNIPIKQQTTDVVELATRIREKLALNKKKS